MREIERELKKGNEAILFCVQMYFWLQFFISLKQKKNNMSECIFRFVFSVLMG